MPESSPKLTGHVVSHTHWDRAWYFPFEIFRLRLVTLVEKLLAIMEHDRHYKFCFDGQTVPFDDYLEIRPQDRPRIERLVREGRLHVGPFYVLPDQYLVTAESLIRNIAIGIREARALGRCQMEGATSDVFGHPSQIPQIFAGFGIPSAIFVRSLTDEQKKRGWVQRWLAPDGRSSVIMYFLPDRGYASLYLFGMDSFDPALYPTIPTDADEWSVALAEKHIDNALSAFSAGAMTTNHLWLGNGVDHQEAQPHTPELIRLLNKRQKKIRLIHSTYEDMMNAVRAEKRRLPVITGQFRYALHGTMTSRVYLKQSYANIAGRTESLAEPLLALVDLFGAGHRAFREPGHSGYTFNPGQNWASFPFYPAEQLGYLWKLLLRNAPHDDLCGCSTDPTHQDMENRFKRAREISEYFADDAMLVMASRFAETRPDSKMPLLVAFNPHAFAVAGRLRGTVFIEGLRTAASLSVRDSRGRAVPFAVDSARRVEHHPFNGNDFQKEPVPGMELALSIQPALAPCAFAAFEIVNRPAPRTQASASAKARRQIVVVDTRFQRVTVHRNGTFDVFDKGLRRHFRGLGLLEDVEDVGDSYNFKRFKRPGKAITSKKAKGRLRIISHDEISTSVEVRLDLRLPAALAPDRKSRSRETVASPVRVLIEIPHFRKGGRIAVSLDNKAKDHELYLAFPTGIAADTFEYDSKFDYDSYEIGEPVARIDSVALVREKGRGAASVAVVSECPTLPQSRKDRRGNAAVLMSLVRCVDRVTASIPKRFWSADEAQCLRTITRAFEWVTGRYPHVRRSCLALRRTINAAPLLLPVTPQRKLRYLDRRCTAAPIPEKSLLEIAGDDIHLSAWKKSDDGRGWVVRVYSLAPKRQTCRISAAVPVKRAHLCNLNELPTGSIARAKDGAFAFPIAPKQIKTVLLELDSKALAAAMRAKPQPRHA